MPNLPISGLPQATALDGTELFASVQGGVTKYTTVEEVSNYVTSSIPSTDTGSLMVTGSISGNIITFTKGDASTFDIDLGTDQSTLSYGIFAQTGSSIPVTGSSGTVVSGSLVDGGVGSLSVPANGFKQGDSFFACMTGIITSGNNHGLEIRMKSGDAILADTGVITMTSTTNQRWKVEVYFTIREIGAAGTASILTAGTFMYNQNASFNFQGRNFSFENTSSFGTTIDNNLEVEAIWQATATSTDSIYSRLFTLEKTY